MASDLKLSDQEKGQRTIDEFIRLVNADHDDVISMGRNQACYMRDEIERLRKRLAELEWQPITAENLPKVGDEVFCRTAITSWVDAVGSYDESVKWWAANYSLTAAKFLRPINPPAARVEGAEEGKNGHD